MEIKQGEGKNEDPLNIIVVLMLDQFHPKFTLI